MGGPKYPLLAWIAHFTGFSDTLVINTWSWRQRCGFPDKRDCMLPSTLTAPESSLGWTHLNKRMNEYMNGQGVKSSVPICYCSTVFLSKHWNSNAWDVFLHVSSSIRRISVLLKVKGELFLLLRGNRNTGIWVASDREGKADCRAKGGFCKETLGESTPAVESKSVFHTMLLVFQRERVDSGVRSVHPRRWNSRGTLKFEWSTEKISFTLSLNFLSKK